MFDKIAINSGETNIHSPFQIFEAAVIEKIMVHATRDAEEDKATTLGDMLPTVIADKSYG